MQTNPSVVATGDFLYFAPNGAAYTIPGAGVVSASSKPGATDPIWTTFALGTVMKPTTDKYDGKAIEIKSPMPGTGVIVSKQVVRPARGLSMEVTMNEISRLAMAAFYKTPQIQLADTSFFPLSGAGSLTGWLQRQRYDQTNGAWVIDAWWVDMDCTELKTGEENIINPVFKFTWLYSALAGSAC